MKNNWILIKLNILDFMKIKNLQNNKNKSTLLLFEAKYS